jgi:RHS repeat-associated protein
LARVIYACENWDGVSCLGNEWFYQYDGAGNLLRFDKWNTTTNMVETVRYIYNSANQIKCVDADSSGACDNGEFEYVYDAYGNLINDGASTYTYDTAMRLKQVMIWGDTTTYAYNGDGDRVAQTANGVQTNYIIDTATPLTMVLAETTGGNTIRYWHGLDVIGQSDGVSSEYFGYDGLGSVRQLADISSSVQLAQTFDPYGNGFSKSGSAMTRLGYSGEQTDQNGFVFLRARYYNPASGRFLNIDPSRMERNPYQYAMGNPILFTDATGKLACQYGIFLTEDSFACGQQITQSYDGVDALIQLFLNLALDKYNSRVSRTGVPIMITGDSAKDRLNWILTLTSVRIGTVRGIQQGTDAVMIGEQGLSSDFIDDPKNPDYQQLSRHFMQGVRFGFAPYYLAGLASANDGELAIKLMLGHEISGGEEFWTATDEDVELFRQALACDYYGSLSGGWKSRNDLLAQILNKHFPSRLAPPSSYVNQPQIPGTDADLRTFLKGYRFGKAVQSGRDSLDGKSGPVIVTRQQAASWLQANIQDRTWPDIGQ